MQEHGRVIETRDGRAVIAFERSSACASCRACRLTDSRTMTLEVENALHAQPGDFVVVQLRAKSFLKASAWAYLFPLFMLMLGIAVGYWLGPVVGWNADLLAAVSALVFAALGFVILKILDSRFRNSRGYIPVMCDIINETQTSEVE